MPNLSINGALNKVYLRQKPLTAEFENFCEQLEILKNGIEKGLSAKESEEYIKNLINNFLSESFYKKTNLVNTKNRIDSAIYKTNGNDSPVLVLIEAKRPSNNGEFPTEANLNSKAMQETLLYFLRERVLEKNIDLKHIIITNGFEWFLFDAHEFETLFYNDKKLLKRYDEFEVNPSLLFDKTSDFYKDIAAPTINNVKTEINYTYFDIRALSAQQKIGVFKLLSPEHLLRKFVCNDSNELNAPFYNELLYILGLEEVKTSIKTQICRLKPSNRETASFIENTINQIEDEVQNENEQFKIALSLTITWINRILFLKLLESQLINYHKGSNEYRFLNSDTISGFDDLHELFFKVLAVPADERKLDIAKKYKNIPYLNSSLFELTENEKNWKISGLRDDKLPIHKQTVLRDNRNSKRLDGELPVLDYLFRFLDAYDFGSEPNDESLTRDNRKTLINASVLGLIFEKINGYKDGSYFTPGTITQYMCRESIRNAVVQKFNEVKKWDCNTFDELADKNFNKTEANQIINSLRICDPAVGSGHFLVSALNELIAIKADLQVLQLKNGKRLKYKVSVENDELMIYDDDGDLFEYNPKNEESQLVQESLFEEKRAIIENCLFGVDINPNSVNICRLRLWIELLKNAYYKEDGEFETLPNIDINIKCGNSLVCYYPVALGSSVSNIADIKKEIAEYKACVKSYKYECNKTEKQKVKEAINKLKRKIAPGVQLSLELEAKDIEANRKALETNAYRNSMEWMIEFPEVLDENGIFLGFDAIIGNPPYIKELGNETVFSKVNATPFGRKYHQGKMDYWFYFMHRAIEMVRRKGTISFITSRYWINSSGAKKVIKHISEEMSFINIVDIGKLKVFDNVVGYHMISTLIKDNKYQYCSYYAIDEDVKNLEDKIFVDNRIINNKNIISNNYEIILAKMASVTTGITLNDICDVSQGIVEASDKISAKMFSKNPNPNHHIGEGIFVLSDEELRELNLTDAEKSILEPFEDENITRYYIDYNHTRNLIYADAKNRQTISENQDFERIKRHLDHMAEYITSTYKPYGLHRARTYDDFIKQKIIGASMFGTPNFAYDDKGLFVGMTYNIITAKEKTNLLFVLGLLNSKYAKDWFFKNAKHRGVGVDVGVDRLRTFPIPITTTDQQQSIITLVEQILAAKKQDPKNDTSELEKKIDLLVYHLYGLTYDEVKMIDETVTEEEFASVKQC